MAAPFPARDKLLSRMTANAEQMMDAYPRADMLLKAAMQEAMPWAMALGSFLTVPAPHGSRPSGGG